MEAEQLLLRSREGPSITTGSARSLRKVVADVVGSSRATGSSLPSRASRSVTTPSLAITASSCSRDQAHVTVSSR